MAHVECLFSSWWWYYEIGWKFKRLCVGGIRTTGVCHGRLYLVFSPILSVIFLLLLLSTLLIHMLLGQGCDDDQLHHRPRSNGTKGLRSLKLWVKKCHSFLKVFSQVFWLRWRMTNVPFYVSHILRSSLQGREVGCRNEDIPRGCTL